MLSVSVLGIVEIRAGEIEIDPLPPKQQAVLAMLAAEHGRTVSVTELLDGIWGPERPPAALGALRNYVWSIRRLLGGTVLQSCGGGYRIDPSLPVDLDVRVMERLRAESETAYHAGDLDTADAALRQAGGRWRGDPLTGVPGPWAEAERARLRAIRRAMRLTAISVDLDRGRIDHAVAELETLVALDPHSEHSRSLLMTALHRAGRRVDALRVFHDTRRQFIELGLEPSQALTDLHQRILTDTVPDPAAVAQARPPAQLPPDTADFTGRETLVGQLCAMTTDRPAGATPVAALYGMGGIGKTTLALHVAHRVRQHFPDGQLFADLRDTTPQAALAHFLRALGVPEPEVPADTAARAALFRSVLSGRRVLVVLDNAADADQCALLLPGNADCAVIITGRRPMTTLPGAQSFRLDLFEPDEAVALFGRIVGPERVARETTAVHRIVELCGLLPLAIRIVAGRIATRPRWSLGAEAERMTAERHRLDHFRTTEMALDQTFRRSLDCLSLEQIRAFRLLADTDDNYLSPTAAAAVLDRPRFHVERLCEELVDFGLLESTGHIRYGYHDLVRVFARTC
ncbi:BTAD domain-containing putative transcriptional regulator [Nocardia sp. GAS34]|uniref:AfsR/SARP family transcriptional regulator n=1 Tax=unclassified Nocardia TaxID=2637762 RepID=UPI003D193F5A